MQKITLIQLEADARDLADKITYERNHPPAPRDFKRYERNLKALQDRYKGLLEKAKNFGKGDIVYKVVIRFMDSKDKQVLHYANIFEGDISKLVNRDLKNNFDGNRIYVIEEVHEIITGTPSQI